MLWCKGPQQRGGRLSTEDRFNSKLGRFWSDVTLPSRFTRRALDHILLQRTQSEKSRTVCRYASRQRHLESVLAHRQLLWNIKRCHCTVEVCSAFTVVSSCAWPCFNGPLLRFWEQKLMFPCWRSAGQAQWLLHVTGRPQVIVKKKLLNLFYSQSQISLLYIVTFIVGQFHWSVLEKGVKTRERILWALINKRWENLDSFNMKIWSSGL